MKDFGRLLIYVHVSSNWRFHNIFQESSFTPYFFLSCLWVRAQTQTHPENWTARKRWGFLFPLLGEYKESHTVLWWLVQRATHHLMLTLLNSNHIGDSSSKVRLFTKIKPKTQWNTFASASIKRKGRGDFSGKADLLQYVVLGLVFLCETTACSLVVTM